jgi:hypothetical protein
MAGSHPRNLQTELSRFYKLASDEEEEMEGWGYVLIQQEEKV